MDAQLMLPRSWVERIFARLHGVYGAQFTAKYATGTRLNPGAPGDLRDVGMEAAIAAWQTELAGFTDDSVSIAYALDKLDPNYPPNAKQFAELCRRAPKPVVQRIEGPKPDPERLKQVANDAKKATTGSANDGMGWARRPVSKIAMDAVLQLERRGETAFVQIIGELRESGHLDGNKPVRLWNAGSRTWVPA